MFFGVLVGVFFVGGREGKAQSADEYVEDQGCQLNFYDTGDGGSYLVENCPQGIDQATVQSEYDRRARQETADSHTEQAARNARDREATGLCTLKADLSRAEIKVLLPDDTFPGNGTITNSDLDRKFRIIGAVSGWGEKTEKEKRDITDKYNLLCFYSSVKRIQTWLVFAAGFLTILFITIGGLLWTTSGTNPNRRKLAEKFIKGALGGFVIVLLALPVLRIVRAFFT